uniref:Superfamily Cerm-13 n=1 Tax=Conus magus TaxID=6492 RepID=A0A5P8I100_CONMA|nr:superfamily Cerm-13 [Conus magus]
MLSMLAWTLMTAMVVMNAKSQYCPTMRDSYPKQHECLYKNALCGKEDSGGRCSSICNCKNGQMCSTDRDHNVTIVIHENTLPKKKRYYTCLSLWRLNECSETEKALHRLTHRTKELKSVKVLCRCPYPKAYVTLESRYRYTCALVQVLGD